MIPDGNALRPDRHSCGSRGRRPRILLEWVTNVLTVVPGGSGSGAEPGGELDLDGDTEGQLGEADRRSGMAPGIAEDLDQQV